MDMSVNVATENISSCLRNLLSEFSESVVCKGDYNSIFSNLLPKYSFLLLLQSKFPDGRVMMTKDFAKTLQKEKIKGKYFYCDKNGNICSLIEDFNNDVVLSHSEEYPFVVWYTTVDYV